MSQHLRLIELAILLAAAMWPVFLFASKIDQDEYMKTGFSVLSMVTYQIATRVYSSWKGRHIQVDNDCPQEEHYGC